jgi:hypothetical protein
VLYRGQWCNRLEPVAEGRFRVAQQATHPPDAEAVIVGEGDAQHAAALVAACIDSNHDRRLTSAAPDR